MTLGPEVVLKSNGIVQAEDENVADDDDAVDEEKDVGHDDVSNDKVKEAKWFRQRSKEVQKHVGDLDENEPSQDVPADTRNHLMSML